MGVKRINAKKLYVVSQSTVVHLMVLQFSSKVVPLFSN